MIPPHLVEPRAVEALIQYLQREIFQAIGDRRSLEDRWIRFEKAYKALPEQEIKEFPFLGAANLVIPVVATDVDTIYSRIMGILFAPDSLWATRALRPEMVDYAPRLKEFLQWAQNHELNAYVSTAEFVLELCKLGTGVLKQRYRRETQDVYQFRETQQGISERILTMRIHDSPVQDHVSLYDFLVPATAVDIQSAPWVAERLWLTWDQYMQRVQAGIYMGSDRIRRSMAIEKGSHIEVVRQEMDLYRPGLGDKLEIWEAWLKFDVMGRGRPMSIVATMHLPSMSLLRLDFNPFMNQEKPFSSAPFLRQEKRFYGIGLAEMLMPFQDEVSTMHNQRLDNKTLSNSTMMKAKRDAGFKDNEPIFPGRWFHVQDMGDLEPLKMGTPFDTTLIDEQATVAYARERTGVNDYMRGTAAPHTGYSTATTTIELLQQAAKRIDQTLRDIRVCLAESGTRIVELYQQFNQGGKEFFVMGPKDGAMVHQILNFPPELMRYSMGIEVTATSAALNKEVEIRTNSLILQMVTQFNQQMLGWMQILLNPMVPQPLKTLAYQSMVGSSILMRRQLDLHGVQDIDMVVPDVREALNAGAQPAVGPQSPAGLLGAGGAPPTPGVPGMAAPAAGVAGLGGLGAGFAPAGF